MLSRVYRLPKLNVHVASKDGTSVGIIEQTHIRKYGQKAVELIWRCDTDTEDPHPGHRGGREGKADALACAWRKAKRLGLVPGFTTPTPEVRYERTP
jgi:hypothetical protein